ncbi:hypothetical protein [Nostoc sphaeroides]|uniref:Uncharacterized protein n=1 Tax=Nostoc sphaeroides CCNUC1 TaxID=2653204 RepID=A0A5P8VVN3_9NOSO|nr:hypothetical protein [Nostoc sphaeroides]QFS44407.1 hypothetical protein GXM_01882 [Nostoc sphaeroides CCNUC1]
MNPKSCFRGPKAATANKISCLPKRRSQYNNAASAVEGYELNLPVFTQGRLLKLQSIFIINIF